MRLGDDHALLEAIRQAGRLMVAQPERFTGRVEVNCNQGGITSVQVNITVTPNGNPPM